MKIKNFTPTTDWYFVFKDPQGKPVNYQLAGFSIIEGEGSESDQVVGMVPVTGGGQNKIMPGVCRLTTVPPVEGTYKHSSELADEKFTEPGETHSPDVPGGPGTPGNINNGPR